MRLEFSQDQQAVLDAVDRIAEVHEAGMTLGARHYETSAALQADLDATGVFEAVTLDELGPVAAAAMIQRLARLPQCAELVASALVLPLLAPSLARPCAVLWDDRDRPARWLPHARAVLCVRNGEAEVATITANDVQLLDSPFGYPVGRLVSPDSLGWRPMDIDTDALRRLWRLGVAAELTGCLDAGLRAVVAHVSDRRQFGRPLGAFQSIQHRLADAAVQVEAGRWLTLQAAFTAQDGDAITALAHLQQAATRITYDLHQFMGAMGLTLEHPLHRWTTRAKMLRADLGGASAHWSALADHAWGGAHAH